MVTGVHSGTVGWGTVQQAEKSWVQFPMSLKFFMDIIFPGLTQPLTEMSTRNTSCGVKVAGAYGWQPYNLLVLTVLKSGWLNLLEPSGPVQACNGIALPFTYGYMQVKNKGMEDNRLQVIQVNRNN